MILRLAVLIQYRRVTWRRHTYKQAILAITRAGKNLSDLLSLQYKENKGKFAASNGRLKAKCWTFTRRCGQVAGAAASTTAATCQTMRD